MTITKLEGPQPRPTSSRETSFWAFLEYPAFWVPAVVITVLGAVALFIAVLAR